MTTNHKLVLVLALLTLSGCATYERISGVPSEGQKAIYKDGRKTLLSTKANVVVIAPQAEKTRSGERANFTVAVKNETQNEILFSTENVSAFKKDAKTGDLVALKVYSYEELVNEEKRRQAWAAVAAALQGMSEAMNASNAGYSTTRGTYSGSAYSSSGASAYGYGSYYGTTYNSGAAQAAQDAARARSDARISNLQSEGEANLRHLASTILKKQTIFPGQWHGGAINVEMPPLDEAPQTIEFLVDVGDEKHLFTFKREQSAK
jgi:hypothetical protein